MEQYGAPSIGFWGGMLMLFNNACGAGLPSVPIVFALGGLVIPFAVMMFLYIASSLSATMLCEAVTVLQKFDCSKRWELTTCSEFLLGRRQHQAVQFIIFLSITFTNIAALVLSCQVLDTFFLIYTGQTCALSFHGVHPRFECADHQTHDSPFENSSFLISYGTLACAVMAIPLSLVNLDDNIIVQIISSVWVFVAIGAMMWSCFADPALEWEQIPAILPDQSQLLGTLFFNFGFAVTVPSWLNDKAPGVSVNRTVWFANTCCLLCYVVAGLVATGFFLDELSPAADLMAVLTKHHLAPMSVVTFPLVAALSGVPIFSVVLRYNMQAAGYGPSISIFLAIVTPWLVTMTQETGSGLQIVINWSSLLFSGFINFFLPYWMYVKVLQLDSLPADQVRGLIEKRSYGGKPGAVGPHELERVYALPFTMKTNVALTIGLAAVTLGMWLATVINAIVG